MVRGKASNWKKHSVERISPCANLIENITLAHAECACNFDHGCALGDDRQPRPHGGTPSSVTVYTSPEINLGEIDREIIDQVGAGGYINFAAFVLSDYAIIDALRSAALRGARIRLYLDPEELTRLTLSEDHPLVKLVHTQGVDTRVKAGGEGLMHLKAYSVSGALLRTGSANESVSGLEHQDNDLEIITDRAAIAAFDRKFKLMWDRPTNVNFNYP
jgi:phosphatidylserine/phosphatidylglycerophosphate/cardiolipin synthase-like enzyme